MNTSDTLYMSKALNIAEQQKLMNHKPPYIGCVIVSPDENIIGSACYDHTLHWSILMDEISSLADACHQATLYITHFPDKGCHTNFEECISAIQDYQIKHVIFGSCFNENIEQTSFIKAMKVQGIQVSVGVLKDECFEINKFFFNAYTKRLPWLCGQYIIDFSQQDYPVYQNSISSLKLFDICKQYDAWIIAPDFIPYLVNNYDFTRMLAHTFGSIIVIDNDLKKSKQYLEILPSHKTTVYHSPQDSALEKTGDQPKFLPIPIKSTTQAGYSIDWKYILRSLVNSDIYSAVINIDSALLHELYTCNVLNEVDISFHPSFNANDKIDYSSVDYNPILGGLNIQYTL
ncbi:hypothetical protein [Zooshikella harenae]|uniref:CMP/dCMP-type deaminase domain-containing protein n=1 Tax=Zooshikella harenae TaxID=2827238 RepID=A0ABS5ZD22_9GAMM|nr:hypothetical protein [Zooshikella harenae]MBU2711962.1 hypothetical protein [Zooshikella harenae]